MGSSGRGGVPSSRSDSNRASREAGGFLSGSGWNFLAMMNQKASVSGTVPSANSPNIDQNPLSTVFAMSSPLWTVWVRTRSPRPLLRPWGGPAPPRIDQAGVAMSCQQDISIANIRQYILLRQAHAGAPPPERPTARTSQTGRPERSPGEHPSPGRVTRRTYLNTYRISQQLTTHSPMHTWMKASRRSTWVGEPERFSTKVIWM